MQIILLSYCSNVPKFNHMKRSHKALCSFVMNISKDGEFLTSLDSLFQCSIMFIMHIFFVIFHQYSFCCSMYLLTLILLLGTFEKSLALSFLQTPISWLQRASSCLLSFVQAEQAQFSPSSFVKCSPAPDHIAGSSLDSLHVFPAHWAAQTRHTTPDTSHRLSKEEWSLPWGFWWGLY